MYTNQLLRNLIILCIELNTADLVNTSKRIRTSQDLLSYMSHMSIKSSILFFSYLTFLTFNLWSKLEFLPTKIKILDILSLHLRNR